MRVPARKFQLTAATFLIMALHSQWTTRKQIFAQQGYSGRQVLGYKLPIWQRDPAWTTEQNQRFITSLYQGINPGTFMYNDNLFKSPEVDQILLDGQQRLSAIEQYWLDVFPVAGEDGEFHYWSELTETEQRHFLRMQFACCISNYETDEECRVAYNLHNFGGTPHREDQRA